MKNKAVSAIPSSYVMIMTLVYALLAAIFLDNARRRGETVVLMMLIKITRHLLKNW